MTSTKTVKDLVVIGLLGGDACDAHDAVALDLDTGGKHWDALVERSAIDALLSKTGAQVADDPEPWDGSRFGDGDGTVEIIDGALVGRHAYERLSGTKVL